MRYSGSTQGSGLLLPFLIAVGCHLLGAWLLWFAWQQSVTASEIRTPKIDPNNIITAVAVQQDPMEALRAKQLAESNRRLAEEKKRQQLEAKRREEARQKALIRQKQEEAKRKEQERKRLEEEKRKADEAKRQAELKRLAEVKRQAELKRQQKIKDDQAKKEKEAASKREAELAAQKARQKALAEEAEKKRQEAAAAEKRALQSALDREEAFLSEMEDREQLASMQMLIKGYVEQNWSRPPTARKGMQAVLRIELLPTGEVKSVSVIESSRDRAFDRSAEQAVFRAGPFRELQDLKPHQRNAFRSFNLVFKPEDIQ